MDRTGQQTSGDEALQRVAQCWDQMVESRRDNPLRGWLDSYYIASHRLNAPVSGSPDVNWLIGLARRLRIPPTSRWLSIGCGAAGQEVGAAQEGVFSHLDAIDISRAALDQGRQLAAAAGVRCINFLEGDFNTLDLARESFDVVFMNMSLHHVEELDAFAARIADCLQPTGHFLINEYIGPRQFQFSDLQVGLVNSLLSALPEALRQDLVSGQTKTAYERKSVEFWNKVDPSEAIRSDLIVPTLERHFEVVERIDYGGAILHLLLEHIIHNFDNGNQYHLAILDLLAKFEDVLIGLGVLTSDFTVMVLQRSSPSEEDEPRFGPVAPNVGVGAGPEVKQLRAELARAYDYIGRIEASRSWRLLERLRSPFGRRWRR